MKLNLQERFVLYGLLPENSGSLAERRLIRSLQAKLKLGEDEANEIEYQMMEQEVDGKPMIAYRWNKEKEKPLELEITDEVKALLKEIVKQVEADKKVNDENFELLEKFDEL